MPTAFDDILNEREKFLQRLRDESRRVARESDKMADKTSDELMARYAAKIEAAERAKKEAIRLYDEEIAHYSALVDELQKTIEATPERQVEADSPRSRSVARRKPRRREG